MELCLKRKMFALNCLFSCLCRNAKSSIWNCSFMQRTYTTKNTHATQSAYKIRTHLFTHSFTYLWKCWSLFMLNRSQPMNIKKRDIQHLKTKLTGKSVWNQKTVWKTTTILPKSIYHKVYARGIPSFVFGLKTNSARPFVRSVQFFFFRNSMRWNRTRRNNLQNVWCLKFQLHGKTFSMSFFVVPLFSYVALVFREKLFYHRHHHRRRRRFRSFCAWLNSIAITPTENDKHQQATSKRAIGWDAGTSMCDFHSRYIVKCNAKTLTYREKKFV